MYFIRLIPSCAAVVLLSLLMGLMGAGPAVAQENYNNNKFRQLYQELATPTPYRTASGAPGHAYYQQRADYEIRVELDDNLQRIDGTERITYYNNSPDPLHYLWLQLDQNMRAKDSDTWKIQTLDIPEQITFDQLRRLHLDFDGGFRIQDVRTDRGDSLPYTIVKTMMRVDLPEPLMPGETYSFHVDYWYNINDRMKMGGRSGYEYFPEEDNYLYTIAQFYPRMAVYNETEGWQHKQFLGRGEFTLNFGDYHVEITVPADHVVSSTGVLQNPGQVLTSTQRERLRKARTAEDPVLIVTEDEARENEKTKSTEKKTWVFEAEQVRDFAFASSRKFIWDAIGVPFDDRVVMCMSFYPKEGNPLWEQYSTRVVAHTIKVYSKYTFDYPYPVAQSIHTKRIGMEYPMICFNYGRPEPDGTYSERIKYGMIGVIIHEVGHNFFPMIVNSDERQWTWMDEGLNSFVQYLTEQEWERNYPSRRGPAHKIVDYMKGDKSYITPIMTNSESIYQFGNNAYGKPATALNILRETVLGRELFDFAFKTYSQRWMFRHPTPEDFFRTMEDASGVDLDWFWRGWFYTTDHVDIALEGVEWFRLDNQDPEMKKAWMAAQKQREPRYISNIRNQEAVVTQDEVDPDTRDFYNEYDPYEVTVLDELAYRKYLAELDEEDKQLLNEDYNYYVLKFRNAGGLIMPIILEFEYDDGSKEIIRIPAEIWKKNHESVSKVFYSKKQLVNVVLDPFLETADVDRQNNYWPPRVLPNRFEVFKEKQKNRSLNKMQRARKAEELKNLGESDD